MAIAATDLVGYLRAEFAKASKLRLRLLLVQLLAAIPGALGVVIQDDKTLYYLAVAGAGLLAYWWLVRAKYQRVRAAAHTARRASLILGGLGGTLSPDEHQRLRQLFTVDENEARFRIVPNYYASDLPPSPARLGEMLEESAFYSRDIHRISATIMGGVFVFFVAMAAMIAMVTIPYADRVTALTAARVFLASSVFLLSSDVLGAAREHRAAADGAEDVRARMSAAYAKGFPQNDVLLAMVDYNSAMEGAPEAVPGVYRGNEARLNQRWAEYKRDRAAARKAAEA